MPVKNVIIRIFHLDFPIYFLIYIVDSNSDASQEQVDYIYYFIFKQFIAVSQ
jgi:hypothetical protein